ncbi:MAG: UDP-N-acetylmuramoyl-L-alanine--D-glutamate ligase [Clostridia bacterium]|nr:UDP-N-acetylmuramoyl-L-alanine--D-glutamate ligase [Clostridia bacterium]
MVMTIQEFKNSVRDKKIAVVGIGVSNLPLVRMLADCGARLCVHDKRTKDALGEVYDELKGLNVQMVLGEEYLDKISENTYMVFKTPGIRYDVPALLDAAEKGAIITSEMELFFETCPTKIIAVTGSDGKTTTTSLIHDMLSRAGYTCHLGGNIGHPLVAEVENMNKDDISVVELSSFQLHTMKKSADIAVITNVTPNHLDWHTDFEEYANSKRAVFEYQKADGRVVLNFENDITRGFGEGKNGAVYFSSKSSLENGYCLKDNKIVKYENGQIKREILDIDTIYIPGMHNVENYMAAIGATEGLVSDEIIRETAVGFTGVPHRIEFVREYKGVKYYNDSIASSPARTTAGLVSFGGKKVILIAGGYDKKIPFDDFGEVVNDYAEKLVLVGATSEKIYSAVTSAKNYADLPIYKCNDFKEAVEKARDVARPGDIVILSPACASFDLFKNFEIRGNCFKEIVKNFN